MTVAIRNACDTYKILEYRTLFWRTYRMLTIGGVVGAVASADDGDVDDDDLNDW